MSLCITFLYQLGVTKSLLSGPFQVFRGFWDLVAEREGFEPPVELPPRRISSAVHSTTLPPLREMKCPKGPVDTGGLMA